MSSLIQRIGHNISDFTHHYLDFENTTVALPADHVERKADPKEAAFDNLERAGMEAMNVGALLVANTVPGVNIGSGAACAVYGLTTFVRALAEDEGSMRWRGAMSGLVMVVLGVTAAVPLLQPFGLPLNALAASKDVFDLAHGMKREKNGWD